MLISEAFPSKYLKASDLRDRQHTLVMDRVTIEDIGDKLKPILYFQGKEKGLCLNKVNSNMIALVYGDETDDWAGREVLIYPTMTDFQGQQVACIRVKVPPARTQARDVPARSIEARPNGTTPRAPTQTVRADLNDEIPF